MKNVELPSADWTLDLWPSGRYWVLEWKGHGAVTIDEQTRCFRSGLTITGRVANKKQYAGRGWKQAIVDDAVKYLENVFKERS